MRSCHLQNRPGQPSLFCAISLRWLVADVAPKINRFKRVLSAKGKIRDQDRKRNEGEENGEGIFQ